MKRSKTFLVVLAMELLFLAGASQAATYTTNDFSATQNPNGTWSYGWSSSLGSAFNLYQVAYETQNLSVWGYYAHPSIWQPSVFYNGTESVVNFYNVLFFQPGQLVLHPGVSGENSIIRWTAPESGTYSLEATFTGLDTTTTDVHILHNGISLYNGLVNGSGDISSLSKTLVPVLAGDTIDFSVGYGANGNLAHDSTGISAIISPVPVPGAVWLLSSGLLGLAGLGRRKNAAVA